MAIGPIKKGALHKQVGKPANEKFTTGELESLKASPNPKTRKRANFALNAKKWNHGGKKKAT